LRGSPAAPLIPVLTARLERDLTQVLKILDEPKYETRIDAFIVGSRADMRRITKRATNGVAFYRTNVIGLVVTPTWSASPLHEILHVVAMNRWGRGELWLNEGLAVYADAEAHGSDVHAAARRLRGTRNWIPLRRLVSSFREQEARFAYPEAGSFVRFIYETYGRDRVERLWREGTDDTRAILGKDLRHLERDWLRALDADSAASAKRRP
jgi:hypothetical protein